MAISLSVTAQALLNQISIEPQIILDIEGVDLIFGARPVLKVLNWDETADNAIWDGDLFWDGTISDSKFRDWISLTNTTTNITQQIAPDKGSTSSISTINVSLIDKNSEVSKALSLNAIGEILGRKAVFSIGFAQGAYPDDANPVFRGVIVDYYTDAGSVVLTIASPESIKRQLFLEKFQSNIFGVGINDVQTGMAVTSTSGLYAPQDALETYLRIEDEIVKVTDIVSDTLLFIERGQLNTLAAAHDVETEVESFYVLKGNPLDLSLKIMLSKEGNEFFQSLDTPRAINYISATDIREGGVLVFGYYDIQEKTGLTIGDIVSIESEENSGVYSILGFDTIEGIGSIIILDADLVTETEFTGTFSYKSKYNVLSTGLGMLTSEVDVAQFESIKALFGANFVDYELYIKDSIDNAKDFIDQQIFFPQGLYSIPRKARSSVKLVVPPFSSEIVPVLGVDSILNADKIKQRRSIHKYHYNTYVFRYNLDSLEDKYLSGKIFVSGDSVARIPVGKKQLKIESDGLRQNTQTELLLTNISGRLIERYQFAPVYFDDIEVNYKTGYQIEVGDIVPFGGESLKVANLDNGQRGTPIKLFEVYNKSLNVKNGNIKLSLVSTSFEVFGRYATVAVSSKILNISTPTTLRIYNDFSTGEYLQESDKWTDYIGQRVAVRSDDFNVYAEVELAEISSTLGNALILKEALPFTPQAGYIVEPAEYSNSSNNNAVFKVEFGHFSKQFNIVSAVNTERTFEIDSPSELQLGSRVVVYSKDFIRDSFGSVYVVDAIDGALVTLDRDLPFVPLVGDVLTNSNFADGGSPYLLI